MKKILLAVCLAWASVATFAQTAAVMLRHEGNVSYFNPTHVTDALNVAADGDTLLLSEGSFSGFTITKKIAVIGAGSQRTYINGSINIELDDSVMTSTYMLDALYITDHINVNKAVTGLKIRKCSFNNISFSGATDNSVMENCYCRGTFNLGPNYNENESSIYGLVVYNSKIANLSGSARGDGAAVLEHCNIKLVTIGGNTVDNRVTLQGCIIGGWSSGLADYYGTPYGGNTIYINCLCNGTNYQHGNPARYTDCWEPVHEDAGLSDDLDYYCNSTSFPISSYLKSYYLCADGTEVGITGGSLPFTLEPTLPTVTESSYEVDNASKTLKVTLKVTSN